MDDTIEKAPLLAEELLVESLKRQTPAERWQQKLTSFLIKKPMLKAKVAHILDICFRTPDTKRTRRALRPFVPKFCPAVGIWLLKKFFRYQMRFCLLPAVEPSLTRQLQRLHNEGVKINLNRLGEAILGEEEAKARLTQCLKDLENPLCDVISVKISSIASQLNNLAWQTTLDRLQVRFETLLQASMRFDKCVVLDMEEYKDLFLTKELFCRVLEKPEFVQAKAGLALQSYLPDSFSILKELLSWACSRGGAPIKIRLVKGANMGMERVEASLKEWPQAPYKTKLETDANFKKMLLLALNKEYSEHVHISVASHNLFDCAYAMLVAKERGVTESLTIEMLAGMAPHLTRAIRAYWPNVLLYCPVVAQDELHTAMAYLARRLDENTAPDNFLSHLFDLRPQNAAWHKQKSLFIASCHEIPHVSEIARRTVVSPTINEPDTDWTFASNRAKDWGYWRNAFHEIPLVIAGKEIHTQERFFGIDPSEPEKQIHSCSQAQEKEIDDALTCAKHSLVWSRAAYEEKIRLLQQTAESIKQDRDTLIGALVQEAGKIIPEADSEVSEAIDFLRYYTKQAPVTQASGVSLVITPWNFPCSIPCSAIASSLLSHYNVIFKPAPEALLSGWLLVNHFWKSGVPKEALQFAPCSDSPMGWRFIKDDRVDAAIFTGSTATARSFLLARPTLRLFGETGGKNSMIVSSLADRDQAVRDIISSAFGYAGQKCSACSLLILEKEVYSSASFRRTLRDASSSLVVGSAWDREVIVNPLIRPPSPHLMRGLTQLENGEEWLLTPKPHPENPHLWSPGIKFGVQKGSFMHQTELFGPLLAVMCAEDLDEAIEFANGTPYGLTAGLHSLDVCEQEKWLSSIQSGNCYINRGITGAIVGRQPFGGCKASSFGMGMKVGGPHYLLQLRQKELEEWLSQQALSSDEKDVVREGLTSYSHWWQSYFSQKITMRRLVGQDNILFFVPKQPLVVFVPEKEKRKEIALLQGALAITGSKASFIYEREKLILPPQSIVRMLNQPDDELLQHIAPNISFLDIAPPSLDGKYELLHWLREVSLSQDSHRYGSLMERESEEREPTY